MKHEKKERHQERARKTITECSTDHIINGLELARSGIPNNPISGGGCACENCIALALTQAYKDGLARGAEIAENLVKEKSWFSGSKYVIASNAIATAIREEMKKCDAER